MRPRYVRKLTTEEKETLHQGLHSSSAFTVRRSQILLKSHERQKAQAIAQSLHCSDQAVREAIHAFNEKGVACLTEKLHARHNKSPLIDEVGKEQQGVRLLTCLLPTKSPWLNPMELIWLHAKRKVVEPDGDLTVKVFKERLYAHFRTSIDEATLKLSAPLLRKMLHNNRKILFRYSS